MKGLKYAEYDENASSLHCIEQNEMYDFTSLLQFALYAAIHKGNSA